mmetsp:Transcript_45485/g.108130  ORF Transcript_45485/g.108130 Transcript_45485/m.108130 type:complete len:394 (-) Transcript_45485:32-1213(-)
MVFQLVHGTVRMREGKLFLEGLPLREAHWEDVVKNKPFDLFVAVRRCEAAIISVEVTIQGWTERPHQVDRLLRSLVALIPNCLLTQIELLEEMTLRVGDVEHEPQHSQREGIVGVLLLSDCPLPCMHNVQFCSKLPAIDHVLRGHVQVKLRDVVKLGETIITNQLDVAKHVAGHDEAVAVVLHPKVFDWLPVHTAEEPGVAFELDLLREDVDGRLLPACPAGRVCHVPTMHIVISPVFWIIAIHMQTQCPIRQCIEEYVLGVVLRCESGRIEPYGIIATHWQHQIVELCQTGCDRSLEHDPPNAPLGTTRLDHPATVEEVVAIQCTVDAGLEVHSCLNVVVMHILDAILIGLEWQAQLPQQRTLHSQLDGHANIQPVKLVLRLLKPSCMVLLT